LNGCLLLFIELRLLSSVTNISYSCRAFNTNSLRLSGFLYASKTLAGSVFVPLITGN
jgi:hypothetical protein